MGRPTKFRKSSWTEEEDMLLRKYVEMYGEGKWKHIPEKTGLNRCRKSCRLRWLNYLRPDIKRGDFAVDEVDLIIRLHRLLGNRWSLIAGRIPGRTANDIKNYWNSHLSRKLTPERKITSSLTNQLTNPNASATDSEWSRKVSKSSHDPRKEDKSADEEEDMLSFWKSLLVEGEEMNTNLMVENKEMIMEDENLFVGLEDLLQNMDLWDVLGQ